MTDYRALCAELADALDHNRQCLMDDRSLTHPLADRARAVLARWGRPAPVPDGELVELVEGLRLISDGMDAIGHESDSWFVARAADLLERHAVTEESSATAPVPVAVSERPWEREGWCDDEGSCWCMSSLDGPPPRWWLVRPEPLSDGWVLPFDALPLPSGEAQP